MNLNFRQSAIKDNLMRRAQIIMAIRQFFAQADYLEVETPLRIPAPAPEAHIDAVPCDGWYLHTSPELCMKRMLAAGYPRIYQICKCFRQKERGRRHLPEMTMLEWYTSGVDYRHMMDQCQALITHVAKALDHYPQMTYQGTPIDLSPPWPRLSVARAFERFGSLTVAAALKNNRFDEIMGLEIEPCLGNDKPLILYDYPVAHAALARVKPEDAQVAERFELYIAGVELCNAFSELTDPSEQRRRFNAELSQRQSAGKTRYPLPEFFLAALDTLPAASGNALGIDRLVMLLTDTPCIDDVVAFTPEEL
jgi:elongation factor P--(R)-beta-lysine ligase